MESTITPLIKSLKGLRLDTEIADVVLVCDGGEIRAHRNILSCRSSYFKTMFQSSFSESQTNRVELLHISVDIMNALLDYIYTGMIEGFNDGSVDYVLEVHQAAHLLALEELADICWKMIMKALDTDNVVDIWKTVLVYGEKHEISAVLHFFLENLKVKDEGNQLVGLTAAQFQRLAEEIKTSNFAVTDSILERIVRWHEDNQGEKADIQDFFLHLNYEQATKEYLTKLIERETSIFTNEFFKNFFISRHVSRNDSKKNVNAVNANGKGKPAPSLFCFGCFQQVVNDCLVNEKVSLTVIDLVEDTECRNVGQIPFFIHENAFIPNQIGTNMYIIGAIPLNDSDMDPYTFFLLYDWQLNSICPKPLPPFTLDWPVYSAVVADTIYVVENYENTPRLFAFSIGQEEWKTITCILPNKVIRCMNLLDTLYFLCMSTYDRSHRLYKLVNGSVSRVCKVPIPSFDDGDYEENLLKFTVIKKIAVYKNCLWIFMFSNKDDLNVYSVYNPKKFQWKYKKLFHNLTTIDCLQCLSTTDSLYFYCYLTDKIFTFHENDYEGGLEELMTIETPLPTDYDLEVEEVNFQKHLWLFSFLADGLEQAEETEED